MKGTPLDCNLCATIPCNYSLDTGQQGITQVILYFRKVDWCCLDFDLKFISQEDPRHNLNWVKKYCTATAVDGFIVYFPFILLVIALVIVLIERVFIR